MIAVPARYAALELPTTALPREGDFGCGDCVSLRQWVDLAADAGFARLSIPMIWESTKANDPGHRISCFAIDPISLDVSAGALPDLEGKPELERLPKTQSGVFAYNQVRRNKLALLRAAFEGFRRNHFGRSTPRSQAYSAFCRANEDWLVDYSLFRLAMEREGGSENWENWDDDRGCHANASAWLGREAKTNARELEKELSFFCYAQWIADEQWRGLRAYADERGLSLVCDLPGAHSPHGVEFYRWPDRYQILDLEGRQVAVAKDVVAHLQDQMKYWSRIFSGFRLSDIRQLWRHFEDNAELGEFLAKSRAALERTNPTYRRPWESLPSLRMQSADVWSQSPSGSFEPDAGGITSFANFTSSSVRRLWTMDSSFRDQLRGAWGIGGESFDMAVVLAVLRKFLDYPSKGVQISVLDLLGIENLPGSGWLASYDQTATQITKHPYWDMFQGEFRRLLQETGRLNVLESLQVCA